MTVGFAELHTPRPLSEWHADMGDVLWWKFPIDGPPYVGTPLDRGERRFIALYDEDGTGIAEMWVNVGGWPGDHTHFTPLPDTYEIGIRQIVQDL